MPSSPTIVTRDLGLMPYGPALDVQRELNQAVIDGHQPSTVLFVEHEPVITLTRRPSIRQHLLVDDDELEQLGVATHDTDRGGDITYHGPGQLVVYPVLKLGAFGLNLSSYMRLIEQVVMDTAGHWGIASHRECGATGVWVKQEHAPDAKLCAMGVRIRKNTTLHGFALNVDPDLSHFDLIVPCGLVGRPVISMKRVLGEACPSMAEVKAVVLEQLQLKLEMNARQADKPSG